MSPPPPQRLGVLLAVKLNLAGSGQVKPAQSHNTQSEEGKASWRKLHLIRDLEEEESGMGEEVRKESSGWDTDGQRPQGV